MCSSMLKFLAILDDVRQQNFVLLVKLCPGVRDGYHIEFTIHCVSSSHKYLD
jgi:hypothetical protein